MLVVLLVAVLIVGCNGAAAALPTVVKLSGMFRRFDPVTGEPYKHGMQELAAFEMAIKDINAQNIHFVDSAKTIPLLKGIRVKRAVREIKGLRNNNTGEIDGDFIDAVNQALDVNKWQSDGMVGGDTNNVANALAQINNGYSQNQVAYGSTGSYLSYIGPYPWYLRVCSDDAFQGTALADVIASQFSWTYLSVFSTTGSDLGYGSDLYQQVSLAPFCNQQPVLHSSHITPPHPPPPLVPTPGNSTRVEHRFIPPIPRGTKGSE